jgi:biopolymer transport protein ExbD
MASGAFGAAQGDASFDLTPMIDVILLLIIFFMLSAQFSRSEQKAIDLPWEQGDQAAEEPTPSEIIIDMTRNGSLSVRGRDFFVQDLASVLGVHTESDVAAKPMVIVRADRSARAEHLNRLATELVRLGLDAWKLGTSPHGTVEPSAGGTP